MTMQPFSKQALQECWAKEKISAPEKIVIISKSGAGSSSQLKQLERYLAGTKTHFFSCGDEMRARQKELGFPTIGDFIAHIKAHPEEGHDEWLDANIQRIGQEHDRLVIEGRLPHILVPSAFTVYLDCSPQTRAERRRKQLREEQRVIISWEKCLKNIVTRDTDDWGRNSPRYPGYDWRPEDFDFVISTEFMPKEEVAHWILEAYRKWLARGMRT
mgnify:FL=1